MIKFCIAHQYVYSIHLQGSGQRHTGKNHQGIQTFQSTPPHERTTRLATRTGSLLKQRSSFCSKMLEELSQTMSSFQLKHRSDACLPTTENSVEKRIHCDPICNHCGDATAMYMHDYSLQQHVYSNGLLRNS